MVDMLILVGVSYLIFKDRPTRQSAAKTVKAWQRKLFA